MAQVSPQCLERFKDKIKNRNFTKHFEQSVVNDIVDKTGVEKRRVGDIQLQL